MGTSFNVCRTCMLLHRINKTARLTAQTHVVAFNATTCCPRQHARRSPAWPGSYHHVTSKMLPLQTSHRPGTSGCIAGAWSIAGAPTPKHRWTTVRKMDTSVLFVSPLLRVVNQSSGYCESRGKLRHKDIHIAKKSPLAHPQSG